jgi:hypothetical protein
MYVWQREEIKYTYTEGVEFDFPQGNNKAINTHYA